MKKQYLVLYITFGNNPKCNPKFCMMIAQEEVVMVSGDNNHPLNVTNFKMVKKMAKMLAKVSGGNFFSFTVPVEKNFLPEDMKDAFDDYIEYISTRLRDGGITVKEDLIPNPPKYYWETDEILYHASGYFTNYFECLINAWEKFRVDLKEKG